MAGEEIDYPKRMAFFANKAVRAMIKTCVANQFGQDVFCLLTVIAHTEDAAHYRRPVNFYNGQLMPLVGVFSESTLKRIRQRAIDSGWLRYIPGSKRKPASYFVQIPEYAQGLDDRPTDEGGDDEEDFGGFQVTGDPESGLNVTQNPDSLKHSRSLVTQNPDGIRSKCDLESGRNPVSVWPPSIPIPIPVPIPVPEDPPNPPQGGTTPLPPSGDGDSGSVKSHQEHPIRRIFAHYRLSHPRSFPKPSPSSKEWKAIKARLAEGYTVEDLCEAIDGCHKSPWHCGENERNRPFQALDLIVRSADKVNQFIEIARRPVVPVLKESEQRSMRAVDQVLSQMFPKGGDL